MIKLQRYKDTVTGVFRRGGPRIQTGDTTYVNLNCVEKNTLFEMILILVSGSKLSE